MTDQMPTLYSETTERALLGALLIDPDLFNTVEVDPADFYIHRNRAIYAAGRGLMRKGITPDVITLCDVIERGGDVPDMAYVTQTITDCPTSYGAEGYAAIIRDYAKRRAVAAIANQLAGLAYDTKRRLDECLSEYIDALGKTSLPDRAARPLSAWASELYDEVAELAANPRDVPGIPTGYIDIDTYIGGLRAGQMFYLAGEPAVGKSKLMLNMALNMGRAQHAGAIFSLEMSGRDVTRRALSILSKVATRSLQTGNMTDDDWAAFTSAIAEAEQLPIYMSDNSALTMTGLRAELSRLKAQFGIEWFALDYLLLLNGYQNADETERSGLLSRGVRQIARDLDLAALTVNSVTKDGMGKDVVPTNKNLRGSGQVVHDADMIAFLVKNEMQKEFCTLVFTKLRDVSGGTVSIDLYQHPNYPAFSDAARYDMGEIAKGSNGRARK